MIQERKVLNDFYGIIINKGKIIERACNDKIRSSGDILEQNE
jgi:hypothetical protein